MALAFRTQPTRHFSPQLQYFGVQTKPSMNSSISTLPSGLEARIFSMCCKALRFSSLQKTHRQFLHTQPLLLLYLMVRIFFFSLVHELIIAWFILCPLHSPESALVAKVDKRLALVVVNETRFKGPVEAFAHTSIRDFLACLARAFGFGSMGCRR